ncbi:MAG: hypothetical protein JJU41_11705 [Bacteroidetes bacterium]|nr:hypothetical protein [Bacteroidota bacterium]MCH8524644.1 hypothetical protein [Balneolales bacterium]
MKNQPSSVGSVIITVLITLLFMFFLNVFDANTPLESRLVMGLLCLLYGVAPFYFRLNNSLGIDLDDKRNAIILSVAGLFLLGAFHSGITYGLISTEMLIAAVVGFGVFLSAYLLVRNNSNDQRSRGA